jgi:hypothetical protein
MSWWVQLYLNGRGRGYSGMSDKERSYWMTKRQSLLMELGAIEDMLGMDRSVVPKRKREHLQGATSIGIHITGMETAPGEIARAIYEEIKRTKGTNPEKLQNVRKALGLPDDDDNAAAAAIAA